MVGCSGPMFANCNRCGSHQGLSSPRECPLAYMQHQRVETGDRGGVGQIYFPGLPEACPVENLMRQSKVPKIR